MRFVPVGLPLGMGNGSKPDLGKLEKDTVQLSNGLTLPNDPAIIAEYNERTRKAERQRLQQKKQREEELRTGQYCPFNDPMNGLHACKKDCALYGADGCAMKRRDAEQDTKGRPCPFLRSCSPDCALYDNGCTL